MTLTLFHLRALSSGPNPRKLTNPLLLFFVPLLCAPFWLSSSFLPHQAHERSLYTDILLGLVRKIRRKRPELRVVVASATLDAALFKRFFETNTKVGRWSVDPEQDTAVIMSVEGRQHSVDLCYLQEASWIRAPNLCGGGLLPMANG